MKGRRVSMASRLRLGSRWKRLPTTRRRRVRQGRLIGSGQKSVPGFSWLFSCAEWLARHVQALGEIERFALWRFARVIGVMQASSIEADERHECDDDDEEGDAGVSGGKTGNALNVRLGQQITQRSSQQAFHGI